MATFVVLASFSDQGIKNVKQTIERADAFKQMATKAGATIKDIYWTLGAHDVIAICEAPDDEIADLDLEIRVDAGECQLFPDPSRVTVDDDAEQQLGADGDDFAAHASPKSSKPARVKLPSTQDL